MRDAQIDAIKTYLYLKIACGCAPLAKLFCQGAFNTLDLEQEELSAKTRTFLLSHPAAAALFEYACLKTDSGEQVSEKLEKQIRKDPESINYEDFFPICLLRGILYRLSVQFAHGCWKKPT